jgi:hypothetical protein
MFSDHFSWPAVLNILIYGFIMLQIGRWLEKEDRKDRRSR